MERLPKQKYTLEFKEEAVQMVLNEKLAVTDAARRLHIPKETLNNWVKKYREKGYITEKTKGLGVSDLEAENSSLKRELAEARMERDILKKAAAYFAKESQRGTR